jgi:uncharacterized protein (TIGR00251 family)
MGPRRNFKLHGGRRGAALAVRITPRASKNEITQILADGTIKIRLTAPPVEGKANAALIQFLADVLEVAPSRIEIVAGMTGRDKLVSVLDLEAGTAQQRILRRLE